MNVTAQKFQSLYELVCKLLAWRNHRTTLPQSRPVGRDSSLREGAGIGFHHSSGYSLKSGVSGDFHRPYGTLMILVLTIHRTTLPQSALAGCQLPQRGSRERLSPFIRVLAKIRGYGRFSSPLRNSKDFGLYHSTKYTPSVTPLRACQLPQRGSRERLAPFIRVLAKIPGCGRFSSPLRKL